MASPSQPPTRAQAYGCGRRKLHSGYTIYTRGILTHAHTHTHSDPTFLRIRVPKFCALCNKMPSAKRGRHVKVSSGTARALLARCAKAPMRLGDDEVRRDSANTCEQNFTLLFSGTGRLALPQPPRRGRNVRMAEKLPPPLPPRTDSGGGRT